MKDITTDDYTFSLFSLADDNDNVDGVWIGSGKNGDSATYEHESHSYGSTETFRLDGGKLLAEGIQAIFTPPTSGDNGVLEGSFDLSLLSLFDEAKGGDVITYLTMSCVNDEAIVDAHISAVPVPAAFWLFGSALIGFIGISRRTRV